MTNEIWRPIPGWEGFYSVSSRGRVRSEDRYISYKDGRKPRLWRGKILAQSLDSDGYSCVGLHRSGKVQNGKVHRLVAIAVCCKGERGHFLAGGFHWEYAARKEECKC